MIFRNLKTRRLYCVVARARDATNARDGSQVTVYAPSCWRVRLAAWLLRDASVFTRDTTEFAAKFRGAR